MIVDKDRAARSIGLMERHGEQGSRNEGGQVLDTLPPEPFKNGLRMKVLPFPIYLTPEGHPRIGDRAMLLYLDLTKGIGERGF
jgi:hypothetical protein